MKRFIVAVLLAVTVVLLTSPAQAWWYARGGTPHARPHRLGPDPCFNGVGYGFAYANPWFFAGFGHRHSRRHFREHHRPHRGHRHRHDHHGHGDRHQHGGRRHP